MTGPSWKPFLRTRSFRLTDAHRAMALHRLKCRAQVLPSAQDAQATLLSVEIPDSWHRFLRPDAFGRWPGLIGNERTLQDLVASLEARNAEDHPLPLSDVPGIAVIEQSAGYVRSPDGPTRWGTAKLSLPGYSEDGYALVYGSYACGSLCGYGWLFVLRKVDGHWRVESATLTVIS
jgi:hypothetical protein